MSGRTGRVVRGSLVALGVLAAAGAAPADGARVELLSLDAAVERALAANPNVRADALAVRRGDEAVGARARATSRRSRARRTSAGS